MSDHNESHNHGRFRDGHTTALLAQHTDPQHTDEGTICADTVGKAVAQEHTEHRALSPSLRAHLHICVTRLGSVTTHLQQGSAAQTAHRIRAGGHQFLGNYMFLELPLNLH